ncbi:MAG: hypothetical protein JRJ12_07600 [Deltaproteobacteria bacterium]|nr:hypothetical protein [Deltaproteobacteria bacterium]MBW2071372.1 hypothetical protein [Deltaproteobacteria bacterium]
MYDHLEIRCPKLGHQVNFGYCRQENNTLPCARAILCWQPYFPVALYLREKLTRAEWDRCFNQQPKEKIVSLLELIEAAKKRREPSD